MQFTRALAAVLALPLALPLAAQDLKLDFKLGGGPMTGSGGNQYFRSVYHLAMEAALPMGRGEAIASAQFRLWRGKSYDATRFGTGYALNSTGQVVTGQITAYALGTDGLPKPDGRYDSVDIRRDNLEGLTLAFGYRTPLPVQGLSVHYGLNLSFLRAQQDVTGGIKVVVDRSVATPVVLGQENFYTQFQKSSMKPGAFVGLRQAVGMGFFVQGDLSLVGFREVNFLPFSYTGRAATTEFKDRTKAILELSLGMNF